MHKQKKHSIKGSTTIYVKTGKMVDAFEKYTTNQPHDLGLDGPGQVAYLCLTGEQAEGGFILNHFEKSVQLLGG